VDGTFQHVGCYLDADVETPVAMARVGMSCLGYFGDLEPSEETIICNLLTFSR